jgi:protein-S-isoprenylcysteine O-methyltransferase Ste14
MATAALGLYAILAVITFGVRVAVQVRRTGSTGLHGLPPGAGALEWVAGGLFIAGFAAVALALILAAAGVLDPVAALDGPVGHAAGIVLAVAGICLVFGAQLAMGDSWRVGVDPKERTDLVTDGPFGHVRNPIYSAMIPTVLGLVLMVPSALAIAGLAILFAGLEMQVRLVEEPYLVRTHGDEYTAYAARVGRFVPKLGLLRGAGGQLMAILVLGAVLVPAFASPPDAAALDSDLKGSAIFRLEASHGYSILGLAASERLDGRGQLALIAYRKGASVTYVAPATVTPSRLDADLGALGRISAEIVPSGRTKRLRSGCGEGGVRTVEPRLYRGAFEFQGEHGYTEAAATDVLEDVRFLAGLVCGVQRGGERTGPGIPGARLRALSRHDGRRLSLQLSKNRPAKATFFSATVGESRRGIEIERTVSGRQPAQAFEYDPMLRTATVELAAPFSGAARFLRGATPASRWTGSLSVDFPGEPNVSLTAPRFAAHLVHAQRTN